MLDESPPAAHGTNRLLTIDALRGIGAFAVMMHHLAGNLQESDWAPSWADFIFENGNVGVPLFFVISGFVIAHSTRRATMSLRFFRIFALKRIIRLDPTYWCVLGFTLAMAGLKAVAFPAEGAVFPSVASFIAHVFYLQDLLSMPPMSPVFWTLCLEVQFYVFFVTSRLLVEKWLNARQFLQPMLFAVCCLSLLQFQGVVPTILPGLFVKFWFLFYLGVVANEYLFGQADIKFFGLVVGVCMASLLLQWRSYVIAGLATTLFIFAAGSQGKLKSWLVNRPLLYLGTISYSLYLIHPEIGWSTISVLKRVLPNSQSPWLGLILFLCGIGASIVAAHCLWWSVERTTNAIAKRLSYIPVGDTLHATPTQPASTRLDDKHRAPAARQAVQETPVHEKLWATDHQNRE